MSPTPRRLNIFWVAVVAGLIGMVLGAVNATLGETAGGLILAVNVVAMLLAFGLCVAWWRGADEAVREAHKWAGWGGGSTGMAMGAALMLTAQWGPGQFSALADMEPLNAFAMGIGLVIGLQAIGYVVAWAWWWLSRR